MNRIIFSPGLWDRRISRACSRLNGRVKNRNCVRFVTFVTLSVMGLAVATAQQSAAMIPRIGLVVANAQSISARELQRGLRELGYVERQNILTEARYFDDKLDQIPSLVKELVQVKVDVLVLSNFRAIRAAKQLTKSIPIVMVTTQNPVETGIIKSLARPGGNVTGLTRLTRDLSGKRLELLKEVLPSMLRVGILWEARRDAEKSGSAIAFNEYEVAARNLKIQLQPLEIRGPQPEIDEAFQIATKARSDALITVHNAVILLHQKRIADLAIKHRLPSLYEGNNYVEAGGLLSYATNDAELYRRSAVYVDKILKGARPSDLPVEQPTKFELVINLKTAKQIGVTIPPNVLARADKVIR